MACSHQDRTSFALRRRAAFGRSLPYRLALPTLAQLLWAAVWRWHALAEGHRR